MAWPESLRKRICAACQWPCEERKSGTLMLARPEAVCPLGRWHAWREPAGAKGEAVSPVVSKSPRVVPASRAASIEQLGPRLWAELHRRPWACDLSREAEWLQGDFAPRLLGCACRTHWRAALLAAPPDLTSHAAYFAWTVARHNEVRRRQGKRELSLAEAYAEWQPGRGSL